VYIVVDGCDHALRRWNRRPESVDSVIEVKEHQKFSIFIAHLAIDIHFELATLRRVANSCSSKRINLKANGSHALEDG